MQQQTCQNIIIALQSYLEFLRRYPNEDELFYRTSFQTLINAVQLQGLDTVAHHEPHRTGIDVDGMPDFFVYQDDGTLFKRLVGFIECKKPSIDIEKLMESDQIKKYAKTTENIILTNYHRFILLQKNTSTGKLEKTQHDFTLTAADNISITKFVNLLHDFYNYQYQWIKTKKTLVHTLATQSFYYSVALREFVNNQNNEMASFYTKFQALFTEYEKSINYHYDLADFCDIYSQSLVYGLLLARLDTGKLLNERHLDYLQDIPYDYKLLYEFLSQAFESRYLPAEIKIALTNIGKNINLIDIDEIQKEFNNINNGKQNIAVYLYEDFLQQYDKLRDTEKRKDGGVYYTPSEASDFITRSVNEIIKTKFGLIGGYNSENVKILDFACGTGTFLHSVFELMLSENMDELQRVKIIKKITSDIYGFELLFTPYIVSHTVLTRFLKEKGIHLENQRLGIFLTNTLDISQHSISNLLPHLKSEYEKAMRIKGQENILAIIGNPPYNVNSQSDNDIIMSLVKDYIPQGIPNVKPIYNDYVKFIRFAQYKIELAKEGVIGIITDNSFLDNSTYFKMRETLLKKFDCIYILDLHGESRKKSIAGDRNIFSIQQGVCISFFIKNKKNKK